MTERAAIIFHWRDRSFNGNLSDEDYLARLKFREELYTLTSPLFSFVEKVFRKFQEYLLSKETPPRRQVSDIHLVNRILVVHANLGIRRNKNFDVSCWRGANGWRILASYFDKFFSSTEQPIDRSTLLTLIRCCDLFSREIQFGANIVLRGRHKYYGRTPELKLGAGDRTDLENVLEQIRILKDDVSSSTHNKVFIKDIVYRNIDL